MVFVRVLTILILMSTMVPAVFGAQETEQSLVFHVKAVPGDDESRFYSIARLTIAALEKGHTVIMVFDGEGARVVRLGSWYGGDTSLLDKLDISDKELASLAESLGLSKASMPEDYGDLLRLFRGKGVELYVSNDMMRHHNITEDIYDNVFIPIEPDRMLEIFNQADMYLSY